MAEGIEETENNSSSADTPAMLGTVIPCEAITAALGGMKREFDTISNSSGIDTGGGGGDGGGGGRGDGNGDGGGGNLLITLDNDGRTLSPSLSLIQNKDGTISPVSMSTLIDGTTTISKSNSASCQNMNNMPTSTSLNNSNTISSSSSATTTATTIGTSSNSNIISLRSSISPQPPPLTGAAATLSTTSLSSASSSSSSSSTSSSASSVSASSLVVGATLSATSGNVNHQTQQQLQQHPINLKSEEPDSDVEIQQSQHHNEQNRKIHSLSPPNNNNNNNNNNLLISEDREQTLEFYKKLANSNNNNNNNSNNHNNNNNRTSSSSPSSLLSHEKATAQKVEALAVAAAAAQAHLNGTMQDMINLQKLQNFASLQQQQQQLQEQQNQQQQQQQHHQPHSSVPAAAAALASLQGLASISSAVALNSPLNLSVGSTSLLSSSVSSTSQGNPKLSQTGGGNGNPNALTLGGAGGVGSGNGGVNSVNNLVGCNSPNVGIQQMPQLILASGQLVQGVQGAQLLIPTSQGISVQTILTIPVSQQINTNEQFLQNYSALNAGAAAFNNLNMNAHAQIPSIPSPQNNLLKPNFFPTGVQQLLATLHPQLFQTPGNLPSNVAEQVNQSAVAVHQVQMAQEQQKMLHLQQQLQKHQQHQQHQQQQQQHQLQQHQKQQSQQLQNAAATRQHQSNSSSPRNDIMTNQSHLLDKNVTSAIQIRTTPSHLSPSGSGLHSKDSPSQLSSASSSGGGGVLGIGNNGASTVSAAVAAMGSNQTSSTLGFNLPQQQQHDKSRTIATPPNTSSNSYSSPSGSQLFRSHSPNNGHQMTLSSTSTAASHSLSSQMNPNSTCVLNNINRLTSSNGELTITKSHGPSTRHSSPSPSPGPIHSSHHSSSSSHHLHHHHHHHQQQQQHQQQQHQSSSSMKLSPSSMHQMSSPARTETSTADLLLDSPNEPTINQATCNVVDGIDLDEIKEFAKAFKLRRLSLGLTQTQVGQALSVTEGPAYSQSAICSALAAQMYAAQLSTQQQNMFEKLDITPKSAQKIKPVLERWMKEAEESHWNRYKTGQNHLTDFIGVEPSKKRKRRTSFTPQALELLNAHFERNTHPSGTEITALGHQLGYEREVIRIWFCNKRQALKNTVRMMSKGMV